MSETSGAFSNPPELVEAEQVIADLYEKLRFNRIGRLLVDELLKKGYKFKFVRDVTLKGEMQINPSPEGNVYTIRYGDDIKDEVDWEGLVNMEIEAYLAQCVYYRDTIGGPFIATINPTLWETIQQMYACLDPITMTCKENKQVAFDKLYMKIINKGMILDENGVPPLEDPGARNINNLSRLFSGVN